MTTKLPPQEIINQQVVNVLTQFDIYVGNFIDSLKTEANNDISEIYDNDVKNKLDQFKQNLYNVIDESDLDETLSEEIAKPLAQEIYDAIYNFVLMAANDPRGPYYGLDNFLLYPTCEEYIFPYVNMFFYFLIIYTIIILLIIHFFKN